MFAAVLFDSDGVLINSMPFHVQAWQTVLKAFNIEVDPEWILLAEGSKAEDLAVDLLARFDIELDGAEVRALVQQKQETYRALLQAQVEPAVVPLVHKIKARGWPLAIVTGSSRKNPMHGLGEDLVALFDALVGGEDVRTGKPSPECYLKAASLLNIRPERCLVVENAPLGIQAGKAAGMKVVALCTTLDEAKLPGADFYYSDLNDLLQNWDVFLEKVRLAQEESTPVVR